MSIYREQDVEKLEKVPLVQDTTHPDFTDDDEGAAGAVVVLDGAPVSGGVPTYDSITQKHTSQVPSGSGLSASDVESIARAAARQAYDDARILIAGLSTTSGSGLTTAQAIAIAQAAARQAFDDARRLIAGVDTPLDLQQVAYAAAFFGG